MHAVVAATTAVTIAAGRDGLAWADDILTAAASLVVVAGGVAGARYRRRANVRLATCEISAGNDGWLVLRASVEIENRGFLRLSFKRFAENARPSITVAETVDVPARDGAGRRMSEVRSWTVHNLDSDLIDPGEIASWMEVFHLDPPTRATVGYRVACKIPVRSSLRSQLSWRRAKLWARLRRAPGPPPLAEWWEDQRFVPLPNGGDSGLG